MFSFVKKALLPLSVSLLLSAVVPPSPVSADWRDIGLIGDLNNDREVTISDLVLLTKHLHNIQPLTTDNLYKVDDSYVTIGYSNDYYIEPTGYVQTADINRDGVVDVFDLSLLRRRLFTTNNPNVWKWEWETTTTTATTTTTVTTTDYPPPQQTDFIIPPVKGLYGSLPSQKDARIAIFCVDFADYKFENEPDLDLVREVAFGKSDQTDTNYPFDSISGFYDRSSKGAVKLSGEVYRYTAGSLKATYENDPWHVKLVDEILANMDDTVDFSQFDGDGDKTVDAIMICVPKQSGNTNWWPAAGAFGGDVNNRADGMNIGHVIVGNAEIESYTNYSYFCQTYIHELGHCMGLPDYYIYGNDTDFEGMHGSAGYEMMDDTNADFGAASKLMLGWYANDQVNVYDSSKGEQVFTLHNAQGNKGNCVIIPNGKLNDRYYSEFFILEFSTLEGNNKYLKSLWWLPKGIGLRAYHVEATLNGSFWYKSWKYATSENENTKNGEGRRFIRLVNEGDSSSDNLLKEGSVIDSSMSNFCWYDSDDYQTIDPGLKITVNKITEDSCTITISPK